MARLGLVLLLLGASLWWSVGPRAADGCEQDLAHLEHVGDTVVLSSEAEGEIDRLAEDAARACAAGQNEQARDTLGEAWSILIAESELRVPAPDAIALDTCTSGMQQVRSKMDAGGIPQLAREGAESLVEDAASLCEQGAPLDAQGKLAMAWHMLSDMP